ncbi:hypothetical protein [Anditalea andensis]|nr:hypothetical protein [Anditalea andensis]
MQKDRIAKKDSGSGASLLSAAVAHLEIQALEQDLDYAVKEMRVLKYLLKTHQEKHEKAGLGAIVVTHRNTFFVCSDLQRLDMEGEKYIAISNQCPLFKSMRSKKKGEKFTHKDLTYHILDIY